MSHCHVYIREGHRAEGSLAIGQGIHGRAPGILHIHRCVYTHVSSAPRSFVRSARVGARAASRENRTDVLIAARVNGLGQPSERINNDGVPRGCSSHALASQERKNSRARAAEKRKGKLGRE